MRVLVLETNLLWSSRFVQGLRGLGDEAVVAAKPPAGDFDLAIVNLGDLGFVEAVRELTERGIPTLGHAGHKEKDLHALGREAGCTRLATNGEITHKLASLLEDFRS